MSHTYRYTTEGYGPYSFDMNIDIEDDIEWIAQEAAENFHDEHAGFESRWPRDFEILDGDDNVVGTCTVDREYEPSFSATAKPQPSQHNESE